MPASYHNGSGGLSFADGHAEIKGWKDARTKLPLRPGEIIPYGRPSGNNADIIWLQQRATRKVR
jgi:prepilin-type processing-associated H-X9-DG protein